ncbi:MAG: hypothetical protein VKJ02_09600 [Snowella sp.]|nr:hypothetical protein [Snowella sp.]
MNKHLVIRCPNCGSLCKRLLSDCLSTGQQCPSQQVAQTECPVCDYFMAICWQNGAVLEAHIPSVLGEDVTASDPHKREFALSFFPLSSILEFAPSS